MRMIIWSLLHFVLQVHHCLFFGYKEKGGESLVISHLCFFSHRFFMKRNINSLLLSLKTPHEVTKSIALIFIPEAGYYWQHENLQTFTFAFSCAISKSLTVFLCTLLLNYREYNEQCAFNTNIINNSRMSRTCKKVRRQRFIILRALYNYKCQA